MSGFVCKPNSVNRIGGLMNCKHCFFWLEEGEEQGLCRRNPPTVISCVGGTCPELSTEIETVFPATSEDDWCGEWQKAEDERIKGIEH